VPVRRRATLYVSDLHKMVYARLTTTCNLRIVLGIIISAVQRLRKSAARRRVAGSWAIPERLESWSVPMKILLLALLLFLILVSK